MLNIVVLVSGGGTNLQAIIDRIEDGSLQNVRIAAVISNNAGAYALERAKQHGIPACCISPKNYGSRDDFNKALLGALNEISPDLIVLAGFLVVIPPEMVERYAGRIILP